MNGFWMVIAGLIVIDMIVVAFVIRKRLANSPLRKLRELSPVEERIADFMRANYSGDPEQLPDAMRGMVPLVEEFARERNIALDRYMIEAMIATCLVMHKLAPHAAVDKALSELREDRDQRAA